MTGSEDGKTTVSYRKGQIIHSQGEPADSIYFIRQGRVKITVVSDQGKEAIVAVLVSGQFFGERCLSELPLHVTTALALDDCVLTRLEKTAVQSLVHTRSDFCTFFVSHLLMRNIQLEEDLTAHLFDSSEKRLARILLRLAHAGEDQRSRLIPEKFSQEALAEMVGTTRSRISQFMNKFRKLGYIDYNGDLIVHNTLLKVLLENNSGAPRSDD